MGAVAEEEEDGPLEDWTRKELAAERTTLGLSDKGVKAVLIARIKEAREAKVAETPAEEEAAVEEALSEETATEDPQEVEAPAVEAEEPTPSEAMEVDEPEAPAVEEVATEAPAAEEPAALEPAAEEAVPAEAPVEEAEVEAAPVEEVAPVEEAVADSDNDSEVTFQTTPRISSRLDVASITALMAKNEEGELSQQEFYRVFLMTVQSSLMANQRLEELESRMTAAEDKINSVEPAAAEAPAAEEAPAVV